MRPIAIALLCFGLCLGQVIKTETFLRPTLEADLGPLIPKGTPVTLRCKGHPGATWYRLMKGESRFQDVPGAGMEVNFLIPSMTKDTAGSYCCLYMNQSVFSEPSEPLELVMTGLFSKPSLSAAPSQDVAPGQNVTLRCQAEQSFNRFVFYKEGGADTSQLQHDSQPYFSIPAVTAAHGGIYQCYVFHSQHPYLWSRHSDPLELRVTGTSSPRPEPPDTLFGLSRLQAGILIGISALLILLFLFLLLVFLLRHHHQQQARLRSGGKEAGVEETFRSCTQAEDASLESPYAAVKGVQMDEHRMPNALVEDPQEVTYAHLIHKSPSQRLEHLPPFPAGESILYAPLAIQLVMPGTAMSPSAITLLGFGLWLSQWIGAQEGTLPRPTLQADPSPLIPHKKSATLRCQGFPGADMYRLRKEGSSQYTDVPTAGRQAEFPIPSVTPDNTGSYYCLYRNQSHWSKPSEPLELVMTGWYDKPSLLALPSPEVFAGENVTLQCWSQQWFEKYMLHKEGGVNLSQSQGSRYHANFHIPEVTAAHGGSYRCYSLHSDAPHEWSAPSDPLELRVKGASPQNYTVGNIVRLGLAGLVLIILGVLLVEAWNSQRRHQEAAQKPLPKQSDQAKGQGRIGDPVNL
ncbi:leukocyte immunoglobulin-like receptor subfamily B member 3 [Trichosurus vulpecula]|uniref:leukocyte immunoglobulin-like receptor subfamily B member 3 n=1 Tax=Trichosurus vulpecula TaxID=9337 RepID=UPI00186B00F5|nr:leukocyte immunoglobulin-like receptor subfamily B member 3 [Trichosurus vulpecula]